MPGNRDKQGRFLKGNSGNPAGRPGIPAEMRRIAKTAPGKIQEIIDDPDTPVRLRADLLKWCYEIVNGKPRQQVDMDANMSSAPVTVSFEGVLDEWSK